MIGLVAFLGHWLYQSYQRENRQLQREIDHMMMMSARSVETTLLNELDTVVSLPKFRRRFLFRDAEHHVDLDSVQVTIKTLNDGIRRRSHFPVFRSNELNKIRKIPGSIGLYLNLFTGVDSMRDLNTELSVLLQGAFDELARERSVPENTHIIFLASDSLPVETGITSTPYVDLALGTGAQVAVHGYTGFLYMAILPEILIALGLLLLTAYTFYLLYRNLKQEKILADAQSDLIANITHELNTPITTASLALEAIQSKKLHTDIQRYAGIAADQLNRLTQLVERILMGVSKSQADALNKVRIDVISFTSKVLDNLKFLASEHNGNIEYITEMDAFEMVFDAVLYEGMITNIVENSLKYGPASPHVIVNLRPQSDALLIEITDNGPGIPEGHISRIFDPFYRVPTGNIHDVKGHGLGLAYVKKVVDLHKGSISVSNQKAGGMLVEILLPR